MGGTESYVNERTSETGLQQNQSLGGEPNECDRSVASADARLLAVVLAVRSPAIED